MSRQPQLAARQPPPQLELQLNSARPLHALLRVRVPVLPLRLPSCAARPLAAVLDDACGPRPRCAAPLVSFEYAVQQEERPPRRVRDRVARAGRERVRGYLERESVLQPEAEGQLRRMPRCGARCLDQQINLLCPQPDSRPTPARARFFAPTHARLRPTPEQPEAQCPNPKKDGIKCTRARSQCMATCRLCDDDSASSCTSPPPPTPPPGADYPCDTAYELRTLTQAYDWYAPHEEEEHASNSSDSYMRASATP